jgi:hypothetical protein
MTGRMGRLLTPRSKRWFLSSSVLLVLLPLAACGGNNEASRLARWRCTDAGWAATKALGRELEAVGFPQNGCDSGAGTAVQIAPFPDVTGLAQAERYFDSRFSCATPRRTKDHFGEPVSRFECTIAGMGADVWMTAYSAKDVEGTVAPLPSN